MTKLLRQIPCIGPIQAACLLALKQTPHRFRSKRQLWTYCGLGIETRDSAQYCFVGGQLQRAKKPQQIRALNRNHNHEMKEIFKGAAGWQPRSFLVGRWVTPLAGERDATSPAVVDFSRQ